MDEKKEHFINRDGSSDEESEGDEEEARRSEFPSAGQIIKTSDLISRSQALTIRPPVSSPSFKGSHGSYVDDDLAQRSIAYRPKQQTEFGPSLSRPGALSGPSTNDRLGAGESLRLAPDSQGNDIPADAKWTKINRRLVSPEVLDQDGRRYEAYGIALTRFFQFD
jgi:hypothetical protein